MAEMAKVVNRDPTAIDRCLACLKRFEVFGAIAQAVREAQWQRSDQALQGGYGQPLPLTLLNRSVSKCCYRSVGPCCFSAVPVWVDGLVDRQRLCGLFKGYMASRYFFVALTFQLV